jgi:hypothetical protein
MVKNNWLMQHEKVAENDDECDLGMRSVKRTYTHTSLSHYSVVLKDGVAAWDGQSSQVSHPHATRRRRRRRKRRTRRRRRGRSWAHASVCTTKCFSFLFLTSATVGVDEKET